MKKELDYFYIDGEYGGDQDWFRDPWMHLGGCGAATACDTCIYLQKFEGKHVYPFDEKALSKKDYRTFAKIMKPYLRPRNTGIDRLDIYTDGFGKYLEDRGQEQFSFECVEGDQSEETAWQALKDQIDRNLPVAELHLRNDDPALKDYVWHWFMVVGYDEDGENRRVKTANYGEWEWLDFKALWNTGYEQRGGLVLIRPDSQEAFHG